MYSPNPNANNRRIGWWEDTNKNRPQANSINAASFIFASAGISLALSIGLGRFPLSSHIQVCWFIAVIIGSCISAALAHRVSIRVFYNHPLYTEHILYGFAGARSVSLETAELARQVKFTIPYTVQTRFKQLMEIGTVAILEDCVNRVQTVVFLEIVASVLVTINGAIYIAAGDVTGSFIVLARYCDGIAFGLTLIPTILVGSEQSVKRFRGRLLSCEQANLGPGGIIATAVTLFLYFPKLQGIVVVIFGLLGMVFTFIQTLESPVFLLRKNDQQGATDVLRRLQNPTAQITDETYELLNENKALLEEDNTRGISLNISNSWIPMAKMILLRCFVTMTYSLPITLLFLIAVTYNPNGPIITVSKSYFIYVYFFMRFLGVMISLYLVDTVGRRIPSVISILAGGVILIVVACLNPTFMTVDSSYTVIYLLLIYQLVSGPMVTTSTCYLSEAFSISVKPYFILAVIITENVLQIIFDLVISLSFQATVFCYTLGALQIIYGIFFFFTMPETKQTTLREALTMFQSMFIERA